ncbi:MULTISPECIES: DUF2777 domain-containing protein [Heyndrickxia]|jgi:hypothetical protein|uniref:DUF2777 domain-containing protein n=1 Tax=Heyndrickxia TaxID=2837504 RepID=UPI000779C096|nr:MULTISPECIES: DUF2777 domain-containing protein [Heyndrickxia]KYC62950.1 hypothetical protein B4100_0454 [Heyndrickxia coagulans]KYC73587.1 hypothetical protein B4096_0327 [Heyndrickxia coagulans]MCI1574787.1 DUF2777 domain-containing protein [Heyndrickxia coagulans]MED4839927.1 DUF2777 domain-containing protein [Weizmannia sp. CD-2023]MED4892803.1 DUF2777 domain-containing protein [Weizmannia sp. CD-2023]
MDGQFRLKIMECQSRAFLTGSIEKLNEEWVFFDDISDEASMLEEFVGKKIEIFHSGRWKKGVLTEDETIISDGEMLLLEEKASLRIPKPVNFSLEMLFGEWEDGLFHRFVSFLNGAGFSIYDCIYCHNVLSFLVNREKKEGVNFMLFDNGEAILSVHHHFRLGKQADEWFECTWSDGRRMLLKKM